MRLNGNQLGSQITKLSNPNLVSVWMGDHSLHIKTSPRLGEPFKQSPRRYRLQYEHT